MLIPALYNLACDGLLPARFAIIGMALDELPTEQFRARLTEDLRKFSTRQSNDPKVWEALAGRLHYLAGNFSDPEAYRRLSELIARLDAELQTGGNVLF